MQSTEIEQGKIHVAAVILAAGKSARLGQPKQLFEFNGKTFIENTIETAIKACLNPIIVVLGYKARQINKIIEKYNDSITILENREWMHGQSSTLRVAIPLLKQSNFTIFLLADQPQIPLELLKKLISAINSTQNNIVATYVGEKRANPVAFSQNLYGELAEIKGDQGGRFLFDKHCIEKVEWADERILIDVDTPEDYVRLKESYGLT
jgi:molybdenum cofactor cytidylyltransferase